METPAEKLASRTWRMQHSAWMLPAFLCAGIFVWASFLYIGIRARRREWLLAAAGYAGAIVVVIIAMSFTDDGLTESTTGAERAVSLVILAIWVGGSIHAVATNRSWLKWSAHAKEPLPWYAEGSATSPATSPTISPTISQPDPLGDALAGRTAGLAPPVRVEAPPTGTTSPSMTPVDLNSATAQQLEKQLGLTASESALITAARTRLGRFTDVTQVLTEAGLEPHRFAQVQPHLVVAASGSPKATHKRGRRLEL
jgi:DNA uptake protein ComE-like DNA-binding protein